MLVCLPTSYGLPLPVRLLLLGRVLSAQESLPHLGGTFSTLFAGLLFAFLDGGFEFGFLVDKDLGAFVGDSELSRVQLIFRSMQER